MKKDLNGLLRQIVEELAERGVTLAQARREFEKQLILATLAANDGNLSRSARSLGVHRNTLRNKVGKLGSHGGDDSARRTPARGKRRRKTRKSP